MSNETNFDFESMKDKALEQLRSGKSLYGKDGAFAPLLKSFLEAALEAEMESHMDDFERSNGNRRNGKTSKQIRTSAGTIDIGTPRDRRSSFEPQLVKKREDRKSTRLNSSHVAISYAVFCLKKKRI